MAWDFATDPEWAEQLAWVEEFVRTECEPIDYVVKESHDLNDPVRQALIPPLQQIVKDRGLWATHLGPHLGGPGYGQVKLALLNEILGRSECAPIVFGSQAPDSGNSEILAHYGTPELKERYLEPLLDNRIISCFSMTEPQGGADPKVFTTTRVQDGDHWVINGEKWFSSFASSASFLIVMAVTDPDAPPYQRHSMFVVPGETPGINVLRDVGLGYQPLGGGGREGYVRYENVRVPADHMLGPRGGAFVVAQTRLGRRPDPPRHAHGRPGAADLRHDLRAGGVAVHPGRGARRQADGPGDDRRLVDGDRGVPAADPANRVEDRPVQRLQGGARRHLGGQGDDAEGAARRVGARAADPRFARHVARDAVRAVPDRVLRPRSGRRPHRGAQGDARPAAAQGREARAGRVPVRTPAAAARGGGGESSPTDSRASRARRGRA